MELVNWIWLEDLLVRAWELEVRSFGERHPQEAFFAACLEFDPLEATLQLSYGEHQAVDRIGKRLLPAPNREEGETPDRRPGTYRELELRPEYWPYRRVPLDDPEGAWEPIRPLLALHARNMAEDGEPDAAEFLWLRFEYLAECVAQRLAERNAFRYLRREADFLVYAAHEHESLEDLEERLRKLYPRYRPATMEWAAAPRLGGESPRGCQGLECPSRARFDAPRDLRLSRCTHCHGWYCRTCSPRHRHPELLERRPLFV